MQAINDSNDAAVCAPSANLLVRYVSRHGPETEGTVTRLDPLSVVYRTYDDVAALRTSEVLDHLQILTDGQPTYSGRAVVRSVVSTGAVTFCEAALEEAGWLSVNWAAIASPVGVRASTAEFLKRWNVTWRVSPQYKVAVAELQAFLTQLQDWLGHLDLAVRTCPDREGSGLDREVVLGVHQETSQVLSALFSRFEQVSGGVDADTRAAHQRYCRGQLHPLLMASPFMRRIYTKPLGYAGDYEMVNMILRDPSEGNSLFAKLLNVFILNQAPAAAHRNRVALLAQRLVEETCRVRRQSRRCRVYNLACGPAGEVEQFLARETVSSETDLTLLDMNDETLDYVRRVLGEAVRRHGRSASLQFIKKPIQHFLRQAGGAPEPSDGYDFVYCAGLFDYLNDRVCQTLLRVCYGMLRPGGLLLVTNVESGNPIRHIMDDMFEWHLIYRDGRQLRALADALPMDAGVHTWSEPTSCNLFLEIRKPD